MRRRYNLILVIRHSKTAECKIHRTLKIKKILNIKHLHIKKNYT